MVITRTDVKPQIDYEILMLIIVFKEWKGKPSQIKVPIVLSNEKEANKFKKLLEGLRKDKKYKRRTVIGWYFYHNEYIKL